MSLNRIALTELLHRNREVLGGLTLELGVGAKSYATLTRRRVTIDIGEHFAPDVVADAHALPFRDDAFGSVLSPEVFEHLHSPKVAMAEVARVMQAGGSALFSVPFLHALHEEPHDYYRYTLHGLRTIVAGSLEVDEIEYFGNRLTFAWHMATHTTHGSRVVRRAVRKVRKMLLPPKPTKRRPRVAAWIIEHGSHEYPQGYVVIAHKRADDPDARSAFGVASRPGRGVQSELP